MAVQRYDIRSAECDHFEIQSPYGEWVKHSDIEALIEENKKMRAGIKALYDLFHAGDGDSAWWYADKVDDLIQSIDTPTARKPAQ